MRSRITVERTIEKTSGKREEGKCDGVSYEGCNVVPCLMYLAVDQAPWSGDHPQRYDLAAEQKKLILGNAPEEIKLLHQEGNIG